MYPVVAARSVRDNQDETDFGRRSLRRSCPWWLIRCLVIQNEPFTRFVGDMVYALTMSMRARLREFPEL